VGSNPAGRANPIKSNSYVHLVGSILMNLTRNISVTHNHFMRQLAQTRKGHRTRGGDVFAAVGDPTRRRVLDMLSRGELAANAIAAPFRISRPAVSRHLTVLRKAGLVSVHRRGREQIYQLRAQPLQGLSDWVEHYRAFWNEKMTALGDYLLTQQKES
jgi:DNA-binding transcriptional ArsR family regulator